MVGSVIRITGIYGGIEKILENVLINPQGSVFNSSAGRNEGVNFSVTVEVVEEKVVSDLFKVVQVEPVPTGDVII